VLCAQKPVRKPVRESDQERLPDNLCSMYMAAWPAVNGSSETEAYLLPTALIVNTMQRPCLVPAQAGRMF
jgi:hypothetical protein